MARKLPKKKKGPARAKNSKPRPAAVQSRKPAPAPTVEATESTLASAEQALPERIIVGIGASAGGLEAFTQLLEALPSGSGMTFVLVQHLAPHHESALPTLLAGRTAMPVIQASEGMQLEPNHIYVIPPNVLMDVHDNRLHMIPRPDNRWQHMPINFFFRSLAAWARERAIGIVLSGTASDGADGLREIKARGGIALAQDPETAKCDGMPRAAAATGIVDLVLSPEGIAKELTRIATHPLVKHLPRPEPAELEITDQQLQRIFAILRQATGVDFTHYKPPTIRRRLQRRMVLHKLERVEHYIRHLQQDAGEVQNLYRDILIHVTRFFREPESFETLSTIVFPKILEMRQGEAPLRIWIPGCSTGEEPYSVAIALIEFLGDRVPPVPVQIFATDISDAAVNHARAGVYTEAITADVSSDRLRRFFTKTDGNFRISKTVRDMCVFARQDLTRDPPFSKLDLIVCRNVLIYLGPVLQKKLMSVFHYALRPHGFLMLGSAETIGPHAELFATADKKQRVYIRKLIDTPPNVTFPIEHVAVRPPPRRDLADGSGSTIQAEANRLVLERFAPPGVIVDKDLQIIQFRGQTGSYLEPAPGDASLSLLKMAREGLLYGLRSAIREARESETTIHTPNLRIKLDGVTREISIDVVPLGRGENMHFLILFGDDAARARSARTSRPSSKDQKPKERESLRVRQLEEELAASREYLQSIIQDVEAANEELQSANEEILSSNEELQSTNEELDTAKEELQSTNEELNTVNEELHGRNEELSRANSDLINLLSCVEIAIVIVASDLRIRRFTPMAEKVLNLIATDVGRPITQIKPNIACPDLEHQIHDVIESVSVRECNVADQQGNSYVLRIRPYKNVDNRIDGAVLALFDVNVERRLDREARDARVIADSIFNSVPIGLVLLDGDQTVVRANDTFSALFGADSSDLQGKSLSDFGDGFWSQPKLRTVLQNTLKKEGRFTNLEVQDKQGRRLFIRGRAFSDGDGEAARLLLMISDGDSDGRNAAPQDL